MTNPESKAREFIDTKLTAAGWAVQNREDINLAELNERLVA